MQKRQLHNQSVAGEVVAVYNKSTGNIQFNFNIGANIPDAKIPDILNLSLGGHHQNIVVQSSPATAANRQKHVAHTSGRKRSRGK